MMHLLRFLGTVLSIVCTLSLQAQQKSDFHPITSVGRLPVDIYKPTYEKVQESSRENYIGFYTTKFYQSVHYGIDAMLQSGAVVFNDSVSNYLSSIVDRLYASKPEVRKKIQVFALRSPIPNAFATHQGLLFVSTGLISYLKNESELAFILAHELSHYEEKHVLKGYINSRNLTSNIESYSRQELDSTIIHLSHYSQNLETMADSLGFELFANAGYDPRFAVDAMKVLEITERPFVEGELDWSFFETADYKVSDKYKSQEILDSFFNENTESAAADTANGETQEEVRYSSHPMVKDRIIALETLRSTVTGFDGDYSQVPASEFSRIQMTCRFSLLRQLLQQREYAKVLYLVMQLDKSYPNSLYLAQCKAKSLYALARYANQHKKARLPQYAHERNAQVQVVNLYLHEQKPLPQTLIALYELGKLKAHENGAFYQRLESDLALDLVDVHRLTLALWDEQITADTVPYGSLFKRIPTADVEGYFNGKTILQDPVPEKAEKKSNGRLTKQELYQLKKKKGKAAIYDEYALGVEHIMMIDPFYYEIHHKTGVNLTVSEKKQIRLNKDVQKVAEAAGLEVILLSFRNENLQTTMVYNNIARFNDWISEVVRHSDVDLIPSEAEYVQQLIDTYKTRHVYLAGVLNIKEKKQSDGAVMLYYTMCIPPLWPVGISRMLSPDYNTYYFSVLFDLSTGKIIHEDIEYLNVRENKGYMMSMLYHKLVKFPSMPETDSK
jgi:Zn-dependent protease with chaperone function